MSWYIEIIKWGIIIAVFVVGGKRIYDKFIKKAGGKNTKWEKLLED